MSQFVKFKKRKRRKLNKNVRFAKSNDIRYFNDAEDTLNDSEHKQSEDVDVNTKQKKSKFDQLASVLLIAEKTAQRKQKREDIEVGSDEDEEERLKYDEEDPLYDALRDGLDETYIFKKYANQSPIKSDCTLCCANCFVFIAYISQKFGFSDFLIFSISSHQMSMPMTCTVFRDKRRQNQYRCFSVDNCSVNDEDEVICNECSTKIGIRETVSVGNGGSESAETEHKKEDKTENEHDGTTMENEEEIWKLISTDFSMLTAPKLNGNNDYYSVHSKEAKASKERTKGLKQKNDDNVYLYNLKHVLPGLI